jgi:hypothetical protein
MLLHAEAGTTTNSYKYLRRWEGMTDHHRRIPVSFWHVLGINVVFPKLLACVGHKCRVSKAVAENLICKYAVKIKPSRHPHLLLSPIALISPRMLIKLIDLSSVKWRRKRRIHKKMDKKATMY